MPREPQSTRDGPTSRDVARAARDRSRDRDERWTTLKRRVQNVARLDGTVLPLAEGLHIVAVERIASAAPIIAELRERGLLSRATLTANAVLARPPALVTREVLASARRDLRALAAPTVLAYARDHRRALARFGDVDLAWVTARQSRLDAVAHDADRPLPRRDASSWFEGVLELASAVHGDEARARLAEASARIAAFGAERRRDAERRIESLASALEEGTTPEASDLAELVPRLARARALPGRARRARVLDVLRAALAWPDAPAAAVRDLASPASANAFAEAVRAAGRALVRSLPSPRDPALRERALEVLAFYGLSFRIGDDGVPLAAAGDVERAFELRDEAASLADTGLTIAQVLAFLALPLKRWQRHTVAEWIGAGLELERVREACAAGYGDDLARAGSARAARAFVTWATRLVPHYKKLGIDFELSPELFAHLPKNEDVAMLAVCLMEQTRERGRGASAKKTEATDPIAVLDATLGMFAKLPQKASGILARLKGTSPGAGARAFPELAAWLGDDALLDRFVHLARLAGVPIALTKQLREDFEHADKAARERAHLESMTTRTSRQEARLAALAAGDRTLDAAPRGRTKRRLAERIEELLPLAYRRELDASFREILREAWGIDVPAMTPAWRDAVRFWLVVTDNRDLLGMLLRQAAKAPGEDVKLAFPKNRAWITKHGGVLRLDRWLAPRRERLVVGDTSYAVALEDDPLEVLRMGIPFGTCLSLEDGCNAASTVLNAIDANKRVLYVRGHDGKVVARKLLVISRDRRLLGYNLYVSTRGEAERPIRAAVNAMCRELAEEVGVPLATSGEPETIHEGFWYDDGAVQWGVDVDVGAYCAKLGLTPPEKSNDALATEARGSAAMETGDVEAAVAVLTRWDTGPANEMLGSWITDMLGVRDAEKRAREVAALVPPVLRAYASIGEDGMVEALSAATRLDESAAENTLRRLLATFPPSGRLARAVADMAARAMRVFPNAGDHGLVHLTFDELAPLLDGVESSFDVLDRIEDTWRAFTAAEPSCEPCRRSAWARVITAVYRCHRRAPDAEAVASCMTTRRRGELAQAAALGIAARETLPGGARAVERLATLRPRLATSPWMLAARLRQEEITRIDDAAEKRLPKPERPPFEALGALLFACEGIERLLARWPSVDVEKWSPGPWELAWYRRHPNARVRSELVSLASRARGASLAMDKLALLGDVEAVEALARRDPRDFREARGAAPAEASKWKVTAHAVEAAKAVRALVRHADEGTLPFDAPRLELGDARLLDVAEAIVRSAAPTDPRVQVALDLLVPSAGEDVSRWDDLAVHAASRGEAQLAVRILERRPGKPLDLRVLLALWQHADVRGALVAAFARAPADWSRRVTACERLAESTGAAVDGLFEACALAVVEQSAAAAAETDTLDQLRTVIRAALSDATPPRAAALYEDLPDDLSASIFLRGLRRLPRDRAAAIRDAAQKLRFLGERGAARSAWLRATRTLKKPRSSSIERE